MICNGQERIMIHQPYPGRTVYPIKTIEIDSLSQLPSKHQFIIDKIMGESMTDFLNNVVFIKGQIIDVETWLEKDSIAQTRYQYIIPKFQLHFELRDTSMGIIKYDLELNLDQYGQVVKFDWPRKNYNKRKEFVNTDSVLKFAVDFAKSNGYKTEVRKFNLWYHKGFKKLCWFISFLQDSSAEAKKYKTIVVDVRRLSVVEETEMFEFAGTIN